MKHNRTLVGFGDFYILPEGHVAIAEAEAIQLVNEQLSKSPLYIDLQTLFQIN